MKAKITIELPLTVKNRIAFLKAALDVGKTIVLEDNRFDFSRLLINGKPVQHKEEKDAVVQDPLRSDSESVG